LQHVYDVSPQMWTYEKDGYRAFVSIPGHHYKSFNLPHYRSIVLRGIAWAGKRDVNSLCKSEELASLRYPEGGPTAPEKESAKLDLHPDFNISLVASEPLINKSSTSIGIPRAGCGSRRPRNIPMAAVAFVMTSAAMNGKTMAV